MSLDFLGETASRHVNLPLKSAPNKDVIFPNQHIKHCICFPHHEQIEVVAAFYDPLSCMKLFSVLYQSLPVCRGPMRFRCSKHTTIVYEVVQRLVPVSSCLRWPKLAVEILWLLRVHCRFRRRVKEAWFDINRMKRKIIFFPQSQR